MTTTMFKKDCDGYDCRRRKTCVRYPDMRENKTGRMRMAANWRDCYLTQEDVDAWEQNFSSKGQRHGK